MRLNDAMNLAVLRYIQEEKEIPAVEAYMSDYVLEDGYGCSCCTTPSLYTELSYKLPGDAWWRTVIVHEDPTSFVNYSIGDYKIDAE